MISNIGNVGIVFRVPDLGMHMTGAPNVLIVKAKDFEKNFVYCFLSSKIGQDLIKSITTGSAQPKFNKTDFRSLWIASPPQSLIKKFNEITSYIYDKIQNNQKNIKKLNQIRDYLLPKLISGEIRV